MKKLCTCLAALGLMFACLFIPRASAIMLMIPESVERIEENAFSSIGDIDAVFIPETVAYIAPDAFGIDTAQVYGFPGSAAESYAASAGRTFVSVAISDMEYTGPAWAAPDAPFTLSATCVTAFWPVEYRFWVIKDGETVFESEFMETSAAVCALSLPGLYNVKVEARHLYATESALFEGAIQVAEHVKFKADLTLTTQKTISPLLEEETRPVTLTSGNTNIIKVDGLNITGVAPGTALLTAVATEENGPVTTTVTVTVVQGVSSITLTAMDKYVLKGTQTRIVSAVSPGNAADKTLAWSSSDPAIATVDQTGLVTALETGFVTIKAQAENGVSAQITLRILSDAWPTGIRLSNTELVLDPGQTHTITTAMIPSGAENLVEWYVSNTSVIAIDEDGTVMGISGGVAYVYARSLIDPNVIASCKVTVLSTSRALVMPERKTAISSISTNLNRISAVKSSAYLELENLYAKGMVSSSVMNARKSVISNVFDSYAFPWMTQSLQPYWKAANSEGGAKDYKPDTVYYGVPYTSHYGTRRYNVARLLSENRFYKYNSSYYMLNQNNLMNGTYCGSDCSALLCMGFFGVNDSLIGKWNTTEFASTTSFKTLSTYETLIPGDILVRSGRHVVMFLYYADTAHTQVVVIEQGGPEAGINCVSTGIYPLSYFYSNSYKPRRYGSW